MREYQIENFKKEIEIIKKEPKKNIWSWKVQQLKWKIH